jgi:vacuolar protein sorting-associated protein 3
MDSSFTVLEQLTEFDPARVANLPQSTPITIRSIAISTRSDSETLLYVGTGGGKLILLSINPSIPDSVQFLQLISIGSRLIEAILVLYEIDRVLVLSDGFLYLTDLILSQPVKKLGFLKEVTAIARRFRTESTNFSSETAENGNYSSEITEDSAGPSSSDTNCISSSSVVAAMGKKLVLIELILSDNNVKVHLKEMLGFDEIKAMAWVNDSIFVGNSNGYFLVSSETGKSNNIFTLPESSGNPKLKPLFKGEEVLLLMDNLGVVIDTLGQPKGGSLVFKCMPDGFSQLSSYLVVSGDAKLEMYRRNGECLQVVDVGKFVSGGLILGGDEMGKGEMVAVATTSKVGKYNKFKTIIIFVTNCFLPVILQFGTSHLFLFHNSAQSHSWYSGGSGNTGIRYWYCIHLFQVEFSSNSRLVSS